MMNILDMITANVDISESMHMLKKESLPLFLYGNGKRAKKVIKELEDVNVDFLQGIIVSDEFYDVQESFLEKYPVYPLSKAIEKFSPFNVIIGYNWEEFTVLTKQLCENPEIKKIYITEGERYECSSHEKHEKLNVLDWHSHRAVARGITYDFIKQNAEKFQQTYQWLSDENSREVMVSYLNGLASQQILPLKDICSLHDQYFPTDIIHLSKQECFVDCGAYNGDTIINFLKACSDSYYKIYALEPDKEAFQGMVDYIKEKNISNIVTFNVGSYSVNTDLSFGKDGGSCGSFSNGQANDTVIVHARTLDSIIDKHEHITFLKMDIEGAELDTLLGASELIMRDKPKLAICVYHKREDLILIPQFIKNLVPEYKLTLRGHSPCCGEVVLYATLE